MSTGNTAPAVGVVHNVVVVQRCQVSDLDGLGGLDDLGSVAVAELRGEQQKHRANTFAAGLKQVPRGGVRNRVGEAQLDLEGIFDEFEPIIDRCKQFFALCRREDAVGLTQMTGKARRTPDSTRIHEV